jgi:hypothetical protein
MIKRCQFLLTELQSPFTHDLVYFAEIGIGTPPQLFEVLVDIGASDSWVSSINCKSCAPGDNRFNTSLSSSFVANETAVELANPMWLETSGNIASDILHIGGFEIAAQLFQEAIRVQAVGLSWDDLNLVHDLLGLTPSSAGSVVNNPSPFMMMASSNLLDYNVMSMRLQEPREIMFGNTNSALYTGNFRTVPLANKTSQYLLTGGWQTQASSLSVDSIP